MKFGMRKTNLKKSFKARTTGKLKRKMKKTVTPLYGKKGIGFVKDPVKSVENKIYHKTTFSIWDFFKFFKRKKNNSTSNSSNSNIQKNDTYNYNLNYINKLSESKKNQLYQQTQSKFKPYFDNMEKAKKYYSLFINNNLSKQYFNVIENCYNKNLELVNDFRKNEAICNKITQTTEIAKTNNAYICMIKAYEKLNEYEKAIDVCKQAIEDNFPNDGTQNGIQGKLERLEKKINK